MMQLLQTMGITQSLSKKQPCKAEIIEIWSVVKAALLLILSEGHRPLFCCSSRSTLSQMVGDQSDQRGPNGSR
jgi:hypothetical protein